MHNQNIDINTKKKALGRGLGSLLPSQDAVSSQATHEKHEALPKALPTQTSQNSAISSETRVWTVQIDKLQPGAFQPRHDFDKESLNELAESIKSNGVVQPITARKISTGLEIVAGERRWRAAQIAGLHEVPVIIKTLTNKQALEIALIENIQRQDLNPIEEAKAYDRLIREFSLTQAELGTRVGRERASVANSLRLLSLPMEVKEMIENEDITVGHAKCLLSLNEPADQIRYAKMACNKKMSVRKLEAFLAMITKSKNYNEVEAQETKFDHAISDSQQKLSNKLGTKVNIKYKDGKGKIEISFYSSDEFNSIYEKILNHE